MSGSTLNLDLLKITLGPVAPWLGDPDVTDILVYGPEKVFVKRQGRKPERAPARWESAEDLMVAAKAIGRHIKRRLDADNPILDSRLPDGSRVNVIIPPCFADGAAVAIRLFTKEKLTAAQLLEGGSFDPAGAEILRSLVLSGKNILISGGTGSGKTTLLNVLGAFIPERDIVVTVEDSREIQLRNELWAPLEAKKAVHEGEVEVTLRDLVRNSLRMNPRWVIVGEVRGPEALDLMRAFNTGHSGMGTVHANSCDDALGALENLILQSGLDIPARAIKEMVARAIHIVIQVCQYPDESRKIAEIAEIRGLDYDTSPTFPPYRVNTLYRFEPSGYDTDGRLTGRFTVVGKPSFLEALSLLKDFEVPEFWR
ncbi:MAG: CpaF family protein [Acidobacteria bacterium]|nr:CpaF family protein [Acidobacteriota bacterium]MBP7868398.1 CpaF family protein [Acidobacteriota bacterium]